MDETIKQRMETDLKTAMKAGDAQTRDAIRFFLAGIKNVEIDKRRALTDDEAITELQRQAKRLNESIEQYRQASRVDLAEREEAQVTVLKRYLPEELSDAEVAALARQVVAEIGATGPRDMGKVMPVLTERAAKRADGRRLSAAAKAALAEVS